MNDEDLLASFEEKAQLLRDRTRGVAEGYSTGLYAWGGGGISKSYTIEETLKQIGRQYKLSNSRMTGKGLFNLLRDYPDSVHVFDDVETLLGEKNAFGLLRSALWGQQDRSGKQSRVICWNIHNGDEPFTFAGGIIFTANKPLGNIPELRALATRIPVLHFQPSNAELAAKMRQVAGIGYRCGEWVLNAEECLEVAKAIIDRTIRMERNLDMRLLVNTFMDRLQWANGASETHWEDLLESRIKNRALPPTPGRPTRAETKAKELDLLRRIGSLPFPERLQAWQAQTGKSPAAMYRRQAELHDPRFLSLVAGMRSEN